MASTRLAPLPSRASTEGVSRSRPDGPGTVRRRTTSSASPTVTSTASPVGVTAEPGIRPASSPNHAARLAASASTPSSQAVMARTPLRRQLVDRQGRDGDAVAQAQQRRQRAERTGRAGGLRPDQAEHEIASHVVELVEATEAEIEVARRPAGELERAELQPDLGVAVVAGGRDVDRDGDRAEVELAGLRRVLVQVQRAGEADATAAVAEEQDGIGRGGVAPRHLDERDVEPALGRRPGLRSRRGGSAELDAQAHLDRLVLGLEHHGDGELRVVVGDDGQPHPSLVVGVDRAVVEDAVEERDERLTLAVVGEDLPDPGRGIAHPTRIGGAVLDDAERGGEVAQHAQVRRGERHVEVTSTGGRAGGGRTGRPRGRPRRRRCSRGSAGRRCRRGRRRRRPSSRARPACPRPAR